MATAEAAMSTERIQKAFEAIDAEKALLANCSLLYKNTSSHFSSLQHSLLQKSQTLESKHQALDSHANQTLESLNLREQSISDRESAAIARLHHQQESALSELQKPPSDQGSLPESLRSFCRKMDSGGLWRFLVANRKDLAVLKTEMSRALGTESVDPARLVLDALEDFVLQKNGKAGLSDQRWVCGVLLRALLSPAAGDKPDGDEGVVAALEMHGVSTSIAERAAATAEVWKGKIDEKEGEGGVGPAEVQMFLQMMVAFGIRSKFDEEFLKKLVVKYPSRREMGKLAAELGFGEKMADIIDEMVKTGKEIEAVYFAHEAGLTEKFSSVALLKAYLKNTRKNASNILKNGHYSQAATEEAGNVELNSLKAIIKCVEDHKLESVFSLETHKRRVSQLEKAKVDRKKNKTTKSKNKRDRGNGVGAFPPAKAGRFSHHWEASSRPNPTSGYPGPYNYPSQGVYEVPPAGSYGAPFGSSFRGQSPTVLPQQYSSYVPENMGGTQSSGSYGTQQPSYAGYDYNAAAGASTGIPPYQSSYPH
ncbi:hypothetical protein AAC387_Pa02g3080 [Persea americana]